MSTVYNSMYHVHKYYLSTAACCPNNYFVMLLILFSHTSSTLHITSSSAAVMEGTGSERTSLLVSRIQRRQSQRCSVNAAGYAPGIEGTEPAASAPFIFTEGTESAASASGPDSPRDCTIVRKKRALLWNRCSQVVACSCDALGSNMWAATPRYKCVTFNKSWKSF